MAENCRKYVYCIAHRSQKEDLHVVTPFYGSNVCLPGTLYPRWKMKPCLLRVFLIRPITKMYLLFHFSPFEKGNMPSFSQCCGSVTFGTDPDPRIRTSDSRILLRIRHRIRHRILLFSSVFFKMATKN
jgi:hypothetical protein